MRNKKYPYYTVPEVRDMKELLEYCATVYGEKTAIWFRKKGEVIKISFKQLKKDVDSFGTYLYGLGMQDKHIAILSENSYEWIVAYFAVVNGGNTVVPLDKENDAESIKMLTGKADVDLIIHSNSYKEEVEGTSVRSLNMKMMSECISEGAQKISDGDTSFLECRIDPYKMCAIVFTSGTTGNPKGVMLSHSSLIKDAIGSARNLYAPEGTVAILPLYHAFGWMACVLDQLILGHGVFVCSSLKRVMEDIKFAAPRHVSIVPLLVSAIYNGIWDNAKNQGKEKKLRNAIKISNSLRKIGIDLRRKLFKQIYDGFGGNLEMIISGGSGIDEKYIKGFDDLGIKLTNGYGITELSPIVATMRNKHFAIGSVGCVNPGTECRIADGEVQLKGETLFLGYYKDEAVTKEAFDGEWFKTGDLGYLDKDGLLYITGRAKNLIILSNGKNVSPEELESKLCEKIPEIKEVLVYGEDDQITAEIFTESDRNIIQEKILTLNRTQPSYKEITKVKFRNTEFPKTTTKKIIRQKDGGIKHDK